MTEGRRARAAALLAGNGLLVLKVFEIYWETLKAFGYRQLAWEFIAVVALGMAGMGAAYALLYPIEDRPALVLEVTAIATFVFPVCIWLIFGRVGS